MVSDLTLVKRIQKKGNNESLKELISRHSALFNEIFQKYVGVMKRKGINIPDAFAEKDYVIYKAVLSFNPLKKCKFSSWLANHARYFCLTIINKTHSFESLDLEESKEPVASQKEDEMREHNEHLFHLINEINDNRIHKIISLRYFSDKESCKWKNISKEMGMTVTTAISLHKKGIRFLRQRVNKFPIRKV